ncbi:MAG: hypothetical protein P4L48_07740 [Mycobacterium sp.]|nr:hypothetical protein [Mycobacterium sp.]
MVVIAFVGVVLVAVAVLDVGGLLQAAATKPRTIAAVAETRRLFRTRET